MSKGSKAPPPPEPPDPKEVAAAQTSTNISTAKANAYLNNVNQVTPYGNLTYNQTGSKWEIDPYTGQVHRIPTFTATQTLSAPQQAIKDELDAAQLNFGQIARDRTEFLKGHLATPFSLDNEAVEGRLMELGRARLDPFLADQREALESRLANQGLTLGTEAYDRAVRNFDQGRNDAFNQLLLTGRQQAVGELLTERNQPINEATAALTGTQVQQPNFINTPRTNIPTTDVAGIINNNYSQQLDAYNADLARRNASNQNVMGGLFSLGSSASTAFSDERLKKNIDKVGDIDGMGIYRYNYKDEPEGSPRHVGLMAQEVLKKKPEAVEQLGFNGPLLVNYGKAAGVE